jgi:hypothetical protein
MTLNPAPDTGASASQRARTPVRPLLRLTGRSRSVDVGEHVREEQFATAGFLVDARAEE